MVLIIDHKILVKPMTIDPSVHFQPMVSLHRSKIDSPITIFLNDGESNRCFLQLIDYRYRSNRCFFRHRCPLCKYGSGREGCMAARTRLSRIIYDLLLHIHRSVSDCHYKGEIITKRNVKNNKIDVMKNNLKK
jgi:hypothetical protein